MATEARARRPRRAPPRARCRVLTRARSAYFPPAHAQMVLNEQAELQKGEGARMASFIGAIAIADLVKSTLGPKGMDKILQSMQDQGSHTAGQIQITNDGATILRSVHVDNAAAKARLSGAGESGRARYRDTE